MNLALQIWKWRNPIKGKDKVPFSEIGKILNIHPEAARSILRRYESDITDKVEMLSILDKEPEEGIFGYKEYEKIVDEFDAIEKSKGYGTYLVVNDLHGKYCNRKALKEAIMQAKIKNINTVIVNGDLFNFDAASKFIVRKDDIAKEELETSKDFLRVLSSQFKSVYIDEGNHDRRIKTLLNSKLPNGYKCFIEEIDAIQIAIDQLKREDGINNLFYSKCNKLRFGTVYFLHPNYFSSIPGRTVINVADSLLKKTKNVSGVVIGHTHYDIKKLYNEVAVFECGCMCLEFDYYHEGDARKDQWTTAYGIIEIDKNGIIDYNNSHVVSLGKVEGG